MNRQGVNEIIRVKRLPSNFVQMHKGFLEDSNLSYKAKGILAYLLTKPDGWIVRVTDLQKHGKDGREAIYNGLRELREHGYYQKNQMRDERGRISHWESVICEVPIWNHNNQQPSSSSPHTGNPYMDETLINTGISPDTGFPYPANPYLEKPYPANPSHSYNESINNELNNNYIKTPLVSQHDSMDIKSPVYSPSMPHQKPQQDESLTVNTAQGPEKPSENHSMTPAEVEQRYEQFWTAFPRKMGKKEGLKAWKKIMPDEILFTAIMAALDVSNQWWQANGTEMRYIPYPATWLAGEHWNNEIATDIQSVKCMLTGTPRRNSFHNFSQREQSVEHYAELERLERQYLLSRLTDGSHNMQT